MDESIRIGRIAGIRVGFNWSLLVVFWLIAWGLAAQRFPAELPGYSDASYWIAALATAAVFFAGLIAHEMGHALVARREGVEVEGITLWLFGGVARMRGEAMSAGAEFRIAIVGPVVSLVLAGAFWGIGLAVDGVGASALLVGVLVWLARINAVLAIFNLVPAFPLDGGRVLRSILWKRRGRVRATVLAARAGRVFGYGLIGLGLMQFAFEAQFGGLWLVFIGWFLLGAARSEESHVLLRGALSGLSVRDVMSPDPVTVPGWMNLDSFIDQVAMTHRFSGFPLIDVDGSLQGFVTLSRVREVPVESRATTRLQNVQRPLEEVPTAAPDEPLADLLDRMPGSSDGRALVLVDGRLVGIVSPRDINRALEMASLREDPAVTPRR